MRPVRARLPRKYATRTLDFYSAKSPPATLNITSIVRASHMTDQKSPKNQAREIIESLPESASWDDVMYELYVREAIEAGLADVAAGRTYSHEEVRARLREVVRRAS